MKKQTELSDELRLEYDMKSLLEKGVRGKYVATYNAGTNLVLLEPDVARAFPNEKAVYEALKLVIKLTKMQETIGSK
ncbi:MAG: hypothetical protein NTZ74_01280 [Chloroflexi bacterium]|nr:hypothetical protein [Chloroflexota bacterium]